MSTYPYGARGGAAVRDTELETGRSRVQFPMGSLEFCIDIIFSAAIGGSGVIQLLTEMCTRGVFLGIKAAGAEG